MVSQRGLVNFKIAEKLFLKLIFFTYTLGMRIIFRYAFVDFEFLLIDYGCLYGSLLVHIFECESCEQERYYDKVQ